MKNFSQWYTILLVHGKEKGGGLKWSGEENRGGREWRLGKVLTHRKE